MRGRQTNLRLTEQEQQLLRQIVKTGKARGIAEAVGWGLRLLARKLKMKEPADRKFFAERKV